MVGFYIEWSKYIKEVKSFGRKLVEYGSIKIVKMFI